LLSWGLLKIADARFEIWCHTIPILGSVAPKFEVSIKSDIKRRVNAWKKKLAAELICAKAPPRIYLVLGALVDYGMYRQGNLMPRK
jgi:hypothetical protein